MDKHVTFSTQGVSTIAEYENYVFKNIAARQRQRRTRGIFEIASKAVLAHTEFAPIGEDNQRYADYFQKVISDYYKDKIQVVIQ